MRKVLLLIFIAGICGSQVTGQQTPPGILFSKAFGGTDFDQANCIAKTSDGGYVIAGSSYSADGDLLGANQHGSGDCMVMKISAGGVLQWVKVYGGFLGEQFNAIQQTADGGYIAAGVTSSVAGSGDVTYGAGGWLVKLNADGTIQWQQKAGAFINAVLQTADGGYVTGGDDIRKFGSDGAWQWTYTSDSYYNVTALCHAHDGGYVAAGAVITFRGNDFRITKLSSNGVLESYPDYGGYGDDNPYSIQPTADGGYIVAGSTSSNNNGNVSGYHGQSDFWVIKVDGELQLQWQKALGGTGYETAYAVIQTNDGGYLVAGDAQSTDGDLAGNLNADGYYDGWVVKLSAAGGLVWQKTVGGSKHETFRGIVQNSDGSYVLTGFTSSGDGGISGFHPGITEVPDAWLLKLAADTVNTLPQSFSSVTQNISGTQTSVFTNNEALRVSAITPGGATPVAGNTTAKVWVDPVPLSGWVGRRYEITPGNNAGTASARITLYYNQAEFNAYNTTVPAGQQLPASPTDNDGKARFRIVKYAGVSGDGTGLPGTYTGTGVIIDPDDNDIVWNSTGNRWEISFDVKGFSGFFATDAVTASTALPVTFGTINAFIKDGILTVNWTAETETSNAYYMVEASTDGKSFTAISDKILSKAEDGNSSTALQYSFTKSYALLHGMAIAFFVLMTGFSRKNRKIAVCMAVISCFVFALSCKKNNMGIENGTDKKLFIRIAQVDKDGTKQYSKIIAVNDER